jgi:hypothetical protein
MKGVCAYHFVVVVKKEETRRLSMILDKLNVDSSFSRFGTRLRDVENNIVTNADIGESPRSHSGDGVFRPPNAVMASYAGWKRILQATAAI